MWLRYLEQTRQAGDGSEVRALPAFTQGVEEFNSGRYFQSHETWEAAWRETGYPARLFLLALTKLGAGFAHIERANTAGAHHALAQGLRCLNAFPNSYAGVDVAGLSQRVRLQLSPPQDEPPQPPQIRFTS
ncbi:MAG: DUF309 domain-containing protein [Dehalococcoidia bacterium]